MIFIKKDPDEIFQQIYVLNVLIKPAHLVCHNLLPVGIFFTSDTLCGRFLVVVGQNRAVLVASVICFQKMYGFHGINHQNI